MKYHYNTPIDVRFEADHGAVTFNDVSSPILSHWHHPEHGTGWTLWYVEPGGNGVEDHFIPGDLLDVDDAVESARRWLQIVGESAR